MADDRPIDRRRFFRQGLRELFKPLASAIEPIERAAEQLARLEQPVRPAAAVAATSPGEARRVSLGAWLRPPGAMEESAFRDVCSRCGDCAKACPAQAIKIDSSGERGGGLPYIDADSQACVVCSGLDCMYTCSTNALVPTPMRDIDMGTAVWDPSTCVRGRGEQCTVCVDQCPLGSAAIEILGPQVHVIEDGCVGCGVCQQACPTQPKSIYVVPRAAR